MIDLDPRHTALVAIDMHRGHLDPEVATLPLPSERCGMDSMDGEEMHRFALRLMAAAVGWVLSHQEILKALRS
jgi:nicotinamidase-related amidase